MAKSTRKSEFPPCVVFSTRALERNGRYAKCEFCALYRSSGLEVFLEILQNSQEDTYVKSLFNKVAGLRAATLFKKGLWHRCFPVNFAKFLRTSPVAAFFSSNNKDEFRDLYNYLNQKVIKCFNS